MDEGKMSYIFFVIAFRYMRIWSLSQKWLVAEGLFLNDYWKITSREKIGFLFFSLEGKTAEIFGIEILNFDKNLNLKFK